MENQIRLKCKECGKEITTSPVFRDCVWCPCSADDTEFEEVKED